MVFYGNPFVLVSCPCPTFEHGSLNWESNGYHEIHGLPLRFQSCFQWSSCFANTRQLLVYYIFLSTHGKEGWRSEMRFHGMTFMWEHPTAPIHVTWGCLPCRTLTSETNPSLFQWFTHSQPNPSVAFCFPQSSLPVFHWQTLCLPLPYHMMWDKCSIPIYGHFRIATLLLQGGYLIPGWISYKATVGPHHNLQCDRALKLAMLIKR